MANSCPSGSSKPNLQKRCYTINPTAGSRDVFLTRWHVSGLKIWTKQWGTGDYDEGRSIAIDSDGDLYVLGDTRYPPVDNPNAGGYDISLNKWKADGTKVWTTQWGTIGDDEANSVAIDSGGNIYVTGRTYGSLDGKPSAGGYDIFVSIITNDTADTDTPDIDTMPDADTPSCADSAWQVDAGVVAECVDGQWVVRRTTKQWGTGDDDGTSVAVDGSGNIYVTGVTAGDFDGNASAGGDDIFLIKWDATGSKAWTKQWGTGNDERGKSVVIDGGGDIYVTGYTAGSLDGNSLSGSNDIFLTKWNPNGSKAWTKQWGTSNGDEGSSVAVDGSGNIYVTGSTAGSFDGNQNAGSSDVFLTKWNSDGTKGWVRQWGTANEDRSYSIALDGSGNIYVAVVAGDVFDVNLTEGVPLVLTKWKPDGAEAWTKQLGMFAYGTGIETSVAIDKGGNIYVAGYTAASYDGNPSMGWYDSFLVKWKADGTKDWSRQWGTDDYDYGEAVAVDGSGNIYVTGRTGGSVDGNPTQGWWDVFLTKWRADGTKVWTKQWGTSDADAGSSVAVDSGGKIYVMGSTKGSFDGNPSAAGDIFLSVIYDN